MIKDLDPSKIDFSGLKLSYLHIVEQVSVTDRPGSDGMLTFRFFEIWNLVFPDVLTRELLKHAEDKGSDLRAVTEDEIKNEQTNDRIKISESAKSIIYEGQSQKIIVSNLEQKIIRVSCASLVKMKVNVGDNIKYFLLINWERKKEGNISLSPIGGGLKIKNVNILKGYDAVSEKPESLDLRFTMPIARLDKFREWFYLRDALNREISPINEIEEELVLESRLLPESLWKIIKARL